MASHIGFLGLGIMGQPMALNLQRSGQDLVCWSRTRSNCAAVEQAGALVASAPAGVFEEVGDGGLVLMMLFDETATDAALQRGTPHFAMVRDRVVVNMSSVAPEYSRSLSRDIEAAGGRFVEAPVSGSRIPAEKGELVAMLAGDEALCSRVAGVVRPMCRDTVYCGIVGNGMLMKLAINIFMLTSAVGLAEAFHFAGRQGLPLDQFQKVADASQMSSLLSRVKLAKLMTGDFTRQGAVIDGVNNTRLITEAAAAVNASTRLSAEVRALFDEANALGHGTDDMIAVIRAIEARSLRTAKD